MVSALIEKELVRKGYDDIRLAHNTLIANLDLEGNTVTQVAERSHMTKQAVGALAEELEVLGYITRRVDERDGRARVLRFTKRGRELLIDSLTVIDKLESRYTAALGGATMHGLRAGLQAFLNLPDETRAPKHE